MVGIHEAKHELVMLGCDAVEGDEEVMSDGGVVVAPSPARRATAGKRDQAVWPIRVDPELAGAVDGLVVLLGEAWERDRARLEALEARGRGTLPRADWPDRPSRHAVLLELLRAALREKTRPRGKRSPGRRLPRAGGGGKVVPS